jgi:aspartate/methionine/tyrosine aminotransferase
VTQEIFKKIPVLSQWICPPKSAFYLFVPLPIGVDGRQFSLDLIEKAHVAVTPGISFGSDFNSFVRVATCGEESTVLKGIGLLAGAIQEIQ